MRDLVRTALNVIDVSLLTSSSDEFSDKLIDSQATEGIEGDISDDNKHEFWKQLFVQKCCEYSGKKSTIYFQKSMLFLQQNANLISFISLQAFITLDTKSFIEV